MKTILTGLLILLFTQGCANAPINDKAAQAAFEALENNLLSTNVLRVDYEIAASGLLSAELRGDLVMQKPALAAISASGTFAGAEVAPELLSDGRQMRGGAGIEVFKQDAPSHLREGLLVGLMRMGILHNLANLIQGSVPSSTDGGVRDWVVAKNFGWQSAADSSAEELRGIRFALDVGGEPAGDVVLWYNPVTGLPVSREQVVNFDAGDMRVNERYKIETDGVIGPCRFNLK